MPCRSSLQALRLALLALDGGITLEPFSDYVVFSLEVGGWNSLGVGRSFSLEMEFACCAGCAALCCAVLRCAALHATSKAARMLCCAVLRYAALRAYQQSGSHAVRRCAPLRRVPTSKFKPGCCCRPSSLVCARCPLTHPLRQAPFWNNPASPWTIAANGVWCILFGW